MSVVVFWMVLIFVLILFWLVVIDVSVIIFFNVGFYVVLVVLLIWWFCVYMGMGMCEVVGFSVVVSFFFWYSFFSGF